MSVLRKQSEGVSRETALGLTERENEKKNTSSKCLVNNDQSRVGQGGNHNAGDYL